MPEPERHVHSCHPGSQRGFLQSDQRLSTTTRHSVDPGYAIQQGIPRLSRRARNTSSPTQQISALFAIKRDQRVLR